MNSPHDWDEIHRETDGQMAAVAWVEIALIFIFTVVAIGFGPDILFWILGLFG